jgi:hypothetical protein
LNAGCRLRIGVPVKRRLRALVGTALLAGLLSDAGLGCVASAGRAASPPVRGRRFDDGCCRELALLEKAHCRVRVANAILTARRDPIGVVCVRDHGAEIEELQRKIAGASVSKGEAADELARLSSEIDLCFGEDE